MGYVGNMSENAAIAYEMGEKPASAWTKNAMIAVISSAVYTNELNLNMDVIEGMMKQNIFDMFFHQTSWHHTGAYYKKTPFYMLDVDFLKTLTNDKLYAMYTEQRKRKRSNVKSMPRFVEVRYKNSGEEFIPWHIRRGYIKGEWFTATDGVRKNINSRYFEVIKEIDHCEVTQEKEY